MPSLVACLGCILLAATVGPVLGQLQEAIFFLPPGLQCDLTNASQDLEDSTSVMFVEDSTQIFPFRFEESGLELCIGPSVINRTVLIFSSYAEGDQVGFSNSSGEDLGGGMRRWTINDSDPVTVVQVLQQFYFSSSITNDAIADNPLRNITVTVYPSDANTTSSNVSITVFLVRRNDPPVLSLGTGNDILTIREDVDTGQPILIIQQPHLLDLSDEELDDLNRIEVALFSPNGGLDSSERIVLMNDGSFAQSSLSETFTSIVFTETAQYNSIQYFSYKSHKDFIRKVSYYMNADEPSLFNAAGERLLRQISITITDSSGENSTTIINVVIESINDHRPVLRFLNATPGCFRLGPPANANPNSAPVAARSTHNTTLVEQVHTSVLSAYNATSNFLSTYGPAFITPSVLLALLAAALVVLLCCWRCKRGTKRQHRTSKLGKRARKYISETGKDVCLPVVQGRERKETDARSGGQNSVTPRLGKIDVQRETPPPVGDVPVKGSLPKDPQKKRKKRREPVTLASLAAIKEVSVTSDDRKSSVASQEKSLTRSAEIASKNDGSIVKEHLQLEGVESTNGSQLALANATTKGMTKPSEGVPKSQGRHATGREKEVKVEVLSPRRVVNATDVRRKSAVEEGEKEEERDAFGDLPQHVLPQRRSCGGLKQATTRQQRTVGSTNTSAKRKKTDAVQ